MENTGSDSIHLNVNELDIAFYPRESIDEERVKEFAFLMAQDEVFPDISVVKDGDGYNILDGVHRFEAIKSLKKLSVRVKVESGINHKHWLLYSAALNLKSSKPLTKSELTSVILKADEDGVPVSEISNIIGYKKSTIYTIIKPGKKAKKEAKKKEALALRNQGFTLHEIEEKTGVPPKTIHNWINDNNDNRDIINNALISLEKVHDLKFSKVERDCYFCLSYIKEGQTVEWISEKLSLPEVWVRNVAHVFLYIYFYESEKTVIFLDIVDYFEISDEKAKILLWFSEFQRQRPDRRSLLHWAVDNKGKYEDIPSRNVIRLEKSYWYEQDNKDKIKNEKTKVDGEIGGVLNDLTTSMKYIQTVEPAIKGGEFSDKDVKDILEHMNRLLIHANETIRFLSEYIFSDTEKRNAG